MVDLASHTILQSFDKDFAKLSFIKCSFYLRRPIENIQVASDINDTIAVVDFNTKNDSLRPIKKFHYCIIFSCSAFVCSIKLTKYVDIRILELLINTNC